MNRSSLLNALAFGSALGVSLPLLAAEPPVASQSASSGRMAAAAPSAAKCLADIRAMIAKMSKDGTWLGGSDFGYGYPMGGYGYGVDDGMAMGGAGNPAMKGYATVRPGFEVRTLIQSADILGQTGQEQTCENVLAAANTVYSQNASAMRDRGVRATDLPGWTQRQIAAAQPVTGKDASFRSDQLLDAKVVSPGDESLGSVHDLVRSPQTGQIAFVVIARGGLFGFDAKYTPVPWSDFKATPNASFLVLDTSKPILAAAPQGRDDQFTKAGQFDAERQKVDTYWSAHIKLASAND
jgi:hypothetical protein